MFTFILAFLGLLGLSWLLRIVIPWQILFVILNLGLIVPVHELGHLVAAAILRIRVVDFSLFVPNAYVATEKRNSFQGAIMAISGPLMGFVPYFLLCLGVREVTLSQMYEWLLYLGTHPWDIFWWVPAAAKELGVNDFVVWYALAHILLGAFPNLVPNLEDPYRGFNDAKNFIFNLGNWLTGYDPNKGRPKQ